MEVYVEEAVTEDECLKKIYRKYGKDVNIIRKHVKVVPRLFGILEKELCEVSFSLPAPNRIITSDIQNKNYEKNVALIEAHAKRIRDTEEKKLEEPTLNRLSGNQNVFASVENDFSEKLKEIVEEIAVKINPNTLKPKDHENLEKIKVILKDNDFSDEYIDTLVETIKKEVTVETLEAYSTLSKKILDYIAASINTKDFEPVPKKKVIVFVGPTGVGKTTSLFKLAALHFVHVQNERQAQPKIHVITTDGYKIGAVPHIEKYCACMSLSFSVVDTPNELRNVINLNKDSMDLLFVDSSGRNPNDKMQLAEVQKFLSAIDKDLLEVHLVVNAGSKMKDIELIMDKYQCCNYDYVIVSKLDETTDAGNVVSVLSKRGVPISYITTGQKVPTHISFASRRNILKKLKGFEKETEYIDENYGDDNSLFGDNIWLTKRKIYENS
ncbi:MAG: hypothetical protein ACTTJ3_06425 [Treponema sp.]